MRTLFDFFWSDWRIGLVAVTVLAAIAGLISAWLTPRGPVTTSQALAWMALALVIGVAAGLVMGSRWSMLITPVVFMIIFELARGGIDGPTVDAIHLGSTYGLIAFIVGRLFHDLLVLAPMIVGAVYRVWFAARFNGSSATTGTVGWTFTGLATLGLIVVVIYLARPSGTHPITGSDGEPLPGSITEIITIPIGSYGQTMMIRSRSTDNPVLLYLAGEPGGTDLGAMRADVTLEQHFVVVTWEQRGAGESYSAIDPADTLTLDQCEKLSYRLPT